MNRLPVHTALIHRTRERTICEAGGLFFLRPKDRERERVQAPS